MSIGCEIKVKVINNLLSKVEKDVNDWLNNNCVEVINTQYQVFCDLRGHPWGSYIILYKDVEDVNLNP